MKCRFELDYFYGLLTYSKTIRAKVVMLGIKPKLMNCRFELTYIYDLLTYLKTIKAKVAMLGIKLELMKCINGQLEIYMNNCKLVLGCPEDNQKFSWATSTLLWIALCTTKRKLLKPIPVWHLFQLHKIKHTCSYTLLSSSQVSTILSFIEARRVVYSNTKYRGVKYSWLKKN
jgi:hypothetical protein